MYSCLLVGFMCERMSRIYFSWNLFPLHRISCVKESEICLVKFEWFNVFFVFDYFSHILLC